MKMEMGRWEEVGLRWAALVVATAALSVAGGGVKEVPDTFQSAK